MNVTIATFFHINYNSIHLKMKGIFLTQINAVPIKNILVIQHVTKNIWIFGIITMNNQSDPLI